MKTLKDAFQYRFPQLSGPGFTRPFMAAFSYSPHDSVAAFLRKAGPFKPNRDAYRFTNLDPAWPITDADAQVVREHYQSFVNAVATLGIQAVRSGLSGLRATVPLTGSVGLPDLVVDWVIDQVGGDFFNQLAEDIIASIPGSYGRCGGMAFSGYDFFQVGWPVATFNVQPTSGDLREFIWSRLLDSLDLNAQVFLEWVMKLAYLPVVSRAASAALGTAAGVFGGPIGAVIGAIVGGVDDVLGLGGAKDLLGPSKDHWTRLLGKMAGEAAWPVGFVYSDKPNPVDQHQVLATRIVDHGNGTAYMEIWDNNSGAMVDVLQIDFRGSELSVTTTISGDIKGIICEDYTFVAPPATLRV
jgi:hypothetical protein